MKKKLPMLPPLPEMQCDIGCGKCCGPVPASPKEYMAIAVYSKMHGITPKRNGVTCPFYQEGQCAVHEVRPGICRIFGHSENLECPQGYNVNVEEDIIREYVYATGNPDKAQLLHHMLIDQGMATDMEDALQLLPSALRSQ